MYDHPQFFWGLCFDCCDLLRCCNIYCIYSINVGLGECVRANTYPIVSQCRFLLYFQRYICLYNWGRKFFLSYIWVIPPVHTWKCQNVKNVNIHSPYVKCVTVCGSAFITLFLSGGVQKMLSIGYLICWLNSYEGLSKGNGPKSAVEEEQADVRVHMQEWCHVQVIRQSGRQAQDANHALSWLHLYK